MGEAAIWHETFNFNVYGFFEEKGRNVVSGSHLLITLQNNPV
jgi:hypothetical protein